MGAASMVQSGYTNGPLYLVATVFIAIGLTSAPNVPEEPAEDEKNELFKEVALMILARATSADTNMQHVEVEFVQETLKRVTGESFTIPEIKIAAHSEIFERVEPPHVEDHAQQGDD